MAPLTKYYLAGVFSVCFLLLAAQAQTTSTTPATTQPTAAEGNSADGSPINKALEPLYSMTNHFIRVVFPHGLRVDTISEFCKLC